MGLSELDVYGKIVPSVEMLLCLMLSYVVAMEYARLFIKKSKLIILYENEEIKNLPRQFLRRSLHGTDATASIGAR